MDLTKECACCGQSLNDAKFSGETFYSGYDIVLRDTADNEVLSSEMDGYLCEDCKDAVIKFLMILKNWPKGESRK